MHVLAEDRKPNEDSCSDLDTVERQLRFHTLGATGRQVGNTYRAPRIDTERCGAPVHMTPQATSQV